MTEQTGSGPSVYDETVFNLLFAHEIARAQRYAGPVTLLRVGLVYRHPSEGEQENAPHVLGALLNARLRRSDIPARLGDEFVVLLTSTDHIGGRAVCERLLRLTPGTQTTPLGFSPGVAVCIGMSTHGGGPGLNGEQLMHEAVEALQIARARGQQSYHVYSDTVRRKFQ